MSKRLIIASSLLRALHLLREGEISDAWETAEAVIENFHDLDSLARSTRPGNADANDRYWIFWRESLLLALEDVLHLNTAKLDVSDDKSELSKKVLEYVNQWTPQEPRKIPSKQEFSNPASAPIYLDAKKTLPGFLKQVDPNVTAEDCEVIQSDFDRAIEASVERVVSEEGIYFQAMLQRSTGAAAEGSERRQQWDAHNRWMRDRFWRSPLWGQEETGISLADLYVPLRGWTKTAIPSELKDSSDETRIETEPRIEVFDLQNELESWLRNAGGRNRLRIIGGGPGSGKSSLAKKLGTSVSEWSDWRVIFVEVQGMERTNDLHSQIGERLRRRRNTGFSENPLDWPKDRGRTLVILDGLDELSRPGPDAVDVMNDFVQGAKDILANDLDTCVVMLGRTEAAKDALKASRNSIDTLLNVLNLAPAHIGGIAVGEEISKKDQRLDYWANYCDAFGGSHSDCKITDPRFGELSYEPVLAYLLILSGRLEEGANLDEVASNKNFIYKDVLAGLLPRDWGTEQHPGTEGLEADDFLFLLSCLGLAAWAGGGRAGREEEYIRIRDLCALESKDYDHDVSSLKNVATQFYTSSDGGYEFVHKTFGEYLASYGLIKFITHRLPELIIRHKRNPDSILEEWLHVAGGAAISLEEDGPISDPHSERVSGGMFAFLRNEAALLSFDEACVAHRHLNDVLLRELKIGFPAHKLDGATWRQAEQRQCFAEANLIACLNSIKRVIAKTDVAQASWNISSGQYIDIISRESSISSFVRHITTRCMSYIDFGRAVGFNRSRGTNIINFHSGELRDTDASGSIIFSFCNMVRSRHFSCNFSHSNFEHANLRSGAFFNCNLKKARLSGVHFEEFTVVNSNFEDAILDRACLNEADFSGALNLTQSQVDKAFGSVKTKLPPGLVMPIHWVEP